MSYWTYPTKCGAFYIVELISLGVDLYFEENRIGHYGNAIHAANDTGGGHHPTLSCAPEDGESLGVPREVSKWTFVSRSRS